ncbi:hypothetical protein FLONG3_5271 [Fusarium longipes]|uniref:C2H2-type domain-containing protein n=1 Tax=Fusarium longipes TaxID=694270 RepID=A0A395SW27_9HYPO|nr:hypothetical protein FLONG3_5271 [Fusarium longipes]
MPSGTRYEGDFWCETCDKIFKTWEDLNTHKRIMRAKGKEHIHCKFCSADFKTEAAEITHIQQTHPHEQNLHCSGCGKGPFARVGGLVAHIQKDCPRIDNKMIEDMRQKKMEFSNALVAATNEPLKNNFASFMPSSGSEASFSNNQVSRPFMIEQQKFPALAAPGSDTQMRNKENIKENDWNKGKKLFPQAPAAQRPTQQQLQHITAPSGRASYDLMSVHNPDHPNFNVARYSCQYTGKFNCPVTTCTKTFKSGQALLGHLRSEAHSETKYRCPYCLNTFGSLASITQHAESNGTKCKIRETDNYGAYMDQLLSGMIDVKQNGYEDGTVRYEVSKNFATRQGPIQDEPKSSGREPYKHEDISW